MNSETKPGGARKGAGRPRGVYKIHMTFSIPITTAQALVGIGNKSRFVNDAILKALQSVKASAR